MELDPNYLPKSSNLDSVQLSRIARAQNLLIDVVGKETETVEAGVDWAINWYEDFWDEIATRHVPTQDFMRQKMRDSFYSSSRCVKEIIDSESAEAKEVAWVAEVIFFLTFGNLANKYFCIFHADENTPSN
jgi:hypothetical protein